jgi:hypothetical protein
VDCSLAGRPRARLLVTSDPSGLAARHRGLEQPVILGDGLSIDDGSRCFAIWIAGASRLKQLPDGAGAGRDAAARRAPRPEVFAGILADDDVETVDGLLGVSIRARMSSTICSGRRTAPRRRRSAWSARGLTARRGGRRPPASALRAGSRSSRHLCTSQPEPIVRVADRVKGRGSSIRSTGFCLRAAPRPAATVARRCTARPGYASVRTPRAMWKTPEGLPGR